MNTDVVVSNTPVVSKAHAVGDTTGHAVGVVYNFFEAIVADSGDVVSDFADGFGEGWDRARAKRAAAVVQP